LFWNVLFDTFFYPPTLTRHEAAGTDWCWSLAVVGFRVRINPNTQLVTIALTGWMVVGARYLDVASRLAIALTWNNRPIIVPRDAVRNGRNGQFGQSLVGELFDAIIWTGEFSSHFFDRRGSPELNIVAVVARIMATEVGFGECEQR
jgi:hypothetical protein